MNLTDVNFLAVVVAAAASMVLGMVWYSPSVFGKKWMHLSGLSMEKMTEMKKKGMPGAYTMAFVGSFVIAWAIAYLVGRMGIGDATGAVKLGLFLGVGFSATLRLGSMLWEGKPKGLWALNTAYDIVNFIVIALITALWK